MSLIESILNSKILKYRIYVGALCICHGSNCNQLLYLQLEFDQQLKVDQIYKILIILKINIL